MGSSVYKGPVAIVAEGENRSHERAQKNSRRMGVASIRSASAAAEDRRAAHVMTPSTSIRFGEQDEAGEEDQTTGEWDEA